MRWMSKLAVIVYSFLMYAIIFMMPPYGDPAIVIWTSKVMSITGFSYDPVCTKNVMNILGSQQLVLCVRAPLYYFLLSLSSEYYKLVPAILVATFIILQIFLLRLNNLSLTVFGLMFPSIYLLFSRTYVDTLTTTLLTALLIVLSRIDRPNGRYNKLFLFTISLLIVLTRESSVILPLLIIITFLIAPELRKRNFFILMVGWIVGVVIWQLYVNISGGISYSDFQPHTPTIEEIYRAVITTITPILPWEVHPEDVQAYLGVSFANSITYLIILTLYLLGFLIGLPIILSLIHFKNLSKIVQGQVVFGLLVSAGLLILKGDIDFFRHLAYFQPVIPLLVEVGLREIREHSKPTAHLVELSYIVMFTLYLARTLRLYTSGYYFDPCQYLIKRPEISSITYFYQTACS